MNRDLMERAENLLLMQNDGVVTDTQTLNAAIRMAHHGKRFHGPREKFQGAFQILAELMRRKYPQCPCSACSKPTA